MVSESQAHACVRTLCCQRPTGAGVIVQLSPFCLHCSLLLGPRNQITLLISLLFLLPPLPLFLPLLPPPLSIPFFLSLMWKETNQGNSVIYTGAVTSVPTSWRLLRVKWHLKKKNNLSQDTLRVRFLWRGQGRRCLSMLSQPRAKLSELTFVLLRLLLNKNFCTVGYNDKIMYWILDYIKLKK